jgi:putative aldouronate transport system permease protein
LKKIKESRNDRIFMFLVYFFLSFCLVIVLYPIIYVISASFSAPSAVVNGEVWLWPVRPTIMGYQAVFKNYQILSGFANSFYYMIFGTLFSLVLTLLTAYPLTRKELYGRNIFTGIFVFTMLFSGGLIPFFLIVKDLHMYDTRWAMIIPAALSIWNVIIARTFIQSTIPDELYEAAQLDGCSDIGFMLKMVVPLSGPIIAVLGMYYAIGQWNSYFNALIFLQTQDYFPLQIILRNILILNNIDPTMVKDFDALLRKQGLSDLLKYSVIVVASVPVLCIYPFVQKYFVKGVMIGSIKG